MLYHKKRLVAKTKGLESLYIKISKFGKIFILLVGIVFAASLIRNIQTILSSDQKIDSADQKLEEVKVINDELKQEVKKVESEHFVELQARDKLGLAKDGETVVILPDEATLRRMAPPQEAFEHSSLPDPNWRRWWKLFF